MPTSLNITNPGAESGNLTGWTNSGVDVRTSSPSPHTGSYYFFGGNTSTASASQNVAVPAALTTDIDAGSVPYKASWFQTSYSDDDAAGIYLIFLDGTSTEISRTSSTLAVKSSSGWTEQYFIGTVPVNTRSVTVVQEYQRYAGTNSDGYIDDISVVFNPVLYARVAQAGIQTLLTTLAYPKVKQTGVQVLWGTQTNSLLKQAVFQILLKKKGKRVRVNTSELGSAFRTRSGYDQ